MLQNLQIAHYALIDQLNINFESGFSIITGETGAGKSIILGALGLLLGQRADSKAIKPGAKKCFVEGTFNIEGLNLEESFQKNDIDFDGAECIVRREVSINGKSRAFVNDTPVSLTQLKSITSRIIDIHSQHQNLLMGEENFLLETLDIIGHNDLEKEDFLKAFQLWNKADKELNELKSKAQKDRSDLDYMQFQLQQIEEAQLQENEQAELENESETLSHAEEIKSALYQTSSTLSEDENNVISILKSNIQQLESISKVYQPAADLSERMESVQIELKDIADEIEHALDAIDFDPQRLDFVDERLNTIYTLEKKHHVNNIEELLELASNLERNINLIANIDDKIEEKENEVATLYAELSVKGKKLSSSREKAGKEIASALIETLAKLGMPSAKLHFDMSARQTPDKTGFDNVQFLFSANKNMPEQDVAQIASGGEIARLMLALKALIAQHRNMPTVIFDEIDTGVSGTMAESMALVMKSMSSHCQVLCITHLPQIAALGKNHYRVYKTDEENGTTSHISLLNQDERIREIANMLSGSEMTDAAINNAKSLLNL